MFSYQLDFMISEGNINSFLMGSKKLFEMLVSVVGKLAESVDVKVDLNYKLTEIESNKISYILNIQLKQLNQPVLGCQINQGKIEVWIKKCISIILGRSGVEDIIKNIENLGKELSFEEYILFVKIPEKYLKKLLEDMEKLSILLFNDLAFYEL